MGLAGGGSFLGGGATTGLERRSMISTIVTVCEKEDGVFYVGTVNGAKEKGRAEARRFSVPVLEPRDDKVEGRRLTCTRAGLVLCPLSR